MDDITAFVIDINGGPIAAGSRSASFLSRLRRSPDSEKTKARGDFLRDAHDIAQNVCGVPPTARLTLLCPARLRPLSSSDRLRFASPNKALLPIFESNSALGANGAKGSAGADPACACVVQ